MIEPQKGDCLLVIDLQPDFYSPHGGLYVADGDQIVKPILELLPAFDHVVATQDWHPRGHKSFASSHQGAKPFDVITRWNHEQVLWPDHCIQGSDGAELPRALERRADLILRKGTNLEVDSYSAFQENYGPGNTRLPTGLMGWMQNRVVRRIIVCGLARDYCVLWSVQDIGLTVPCIVLWDHTRAVMPSNDEQTRTTMIAAGAQIP